MSGPDPPTRTPFLPPLCDHQAGRTGRLSFALVAEPWGAAALPVDSHIKSYSLRRNTIIQAREKGAESHARGILIKAEGAFYETSSEVLEQTLGGRLKTQSARLRDVSWRKEKDSDGGGATAVSLCGTNLGVHPAGRPFTPTRVHSLQWRARHKVQVRHVECKQIQMQRLASLSSVASLRLFVCPGCRNADEVSRRTPFVKYWNKSRRVLTNKQVIQ